VTTPLSRFPKPEAKQYKGQRKLFLVPNFAFSPDVPEEGQQLLERYWSEVRDHVHNLERSLGPVVHVFHEAVFSEGDDGMKMVEGLNPGGNSFVQALCRSTARLEATEDQALVAESSDWQRCLSIGLISENVLNTALSGYQEIAQKRFEHIASRIGETLAEDESGVLFIREDHRVQFPSDVQVFYVAPPALDALKRWINDQVRVATQAAQQPPEPSESSEPSESEGS
jgi:hypothetical protein